MKQTTLFLWMVVLCIVYAVTMRAELLIVQKGDDGRFIPLPAKNADESVWGPIKQYQWPQCIINSAHMSEQEKTDLLLKGSAYAEERFIQNKLSQIDNQYQVIFVPTTLYDLFCIYHLFNTQKDQNPLQAEIRKIIGARILEDIEEPNVYDINLTPLINQNDSFRNILKSVYKKYDDINALFFVNGVWGYINDEFARFLFQHYPDLRISADAFELAEKIKIQSKGIAALLVKTLKSLDKHVRSMGQRLELPQAQEQNRTSPSILVSVLKDLSDMISQVIDLEYEARESNTALLLRGASFKPFQVEFGSQHRPKKLAGSTVSQAEEKKEEEARTLEKSYAMKEIPPSSISFGASLFAGSLRDRGASVYHFLMGGRSDLERPRDVENSIGYALFINKKAYVEHRINNLFFIPPLITLAALLESGEYFHARTTAAVPFKKPEGHVIRGLASVMRITDPSGVILLTRDPLLHAELFSNYIAQHGKIFQKGSLKLLTEEEQKFVQEVLTSQKQAAQFYKTTRRFKRVVDKNTQRIRARKQKVPVTQQVEQQAPEASVGAEIGIEE